MNFQTLFRCHMILQIFFKFVICCFGAQETFLIIINDEKSFAT